MGAATNRPSLGQKEGMMTEHSEIWEARLKLSILAEPGDTEMAEHIAQRGPINALQSILDGTAGDEIQRKAGGRVGMLERESLRVLEQMKRLGINFITPEMYAWGSRFNDLMVDPIGLYVRGDWALLSEAAVAFVGARASTPYGELIARDLVADVSAEGYVIASGGAYGIDGAAHRAALASGGKTVAFLAGGVDRPYPAGHASLLQQIVDAGGALVSEIPPGGTPTKWRFLQRNRLIAAHGLMTVVVEAGMRSGSLNTAAHAERLHRFVGAVPGPLTSAASAGCHRLIKENRALLIEGSADILGAIA